MTHPSLPRTLALALLLGIASAAPARRVCAQATEGAAEPPSYRGAVDDAVGEYEAQHFPEARALFARAHALYPNARTLRGLGMVEFELRNYGTSIEHLEAALASTVRPLEGVLRSETEQLLERARGFVAHVALKVTPGAARVVVDGIPVEVAPGKALVLQVGDHTLEVQADGYSPERRTLSLRGGETQALQIALRSPTTAVAEERAPKSSPLPWVMLSTGAALAITGAAVAGVGLKKKADVESAPREISSAEIENDQHRSEALTGAGFAVGGVGLATFGAGLLWKLIARSRREDVAIQVSSHRGPLLIAGSF